MAAKEKFAGCTVHYVSAEIDGGQIIAQRRVKVDCAETPWELGGRVFLQENELLVEVIRQLQSQSQNHN
jgi:phosphoribosylglycinamide formyltransferase-1